MVLFWSVFYFKLSLDTLRLSVSLILFVLQVGFFLPFSSLIFFLFPSLDLFFGKYLSLFACMLSPNIPSFDSLFSNSLTLYLYHCLFVCFTFFFPFFLTLSLSFFLSLSNQHTLTVPLLSLSLSLSFLYHINTRLFSLSLSLCIS